VPGNPRAGALDRNLRRRLEMVRFRWRPGPAGPTVSADWPQPARTVRV